MDCSIFSDKMKVPSADDLRMSLGRTFELWQRIRDFAVANYPGALEEWNYPGDKYGWSFRIKDKKRAILYMLPRDGFFKVAMVFGQKATDEILASRISPKIIEELRAAKVYAEGRGIRIDVENEKVVCDIFNLITIKLKH
jgi:Protein of unknown function (DUF3788)